MKHPGNEEWMSYLYDECDTDERHRLEAHAAVCGECGAKLANWRGVTARLDADREVPAGAGRRFGRRVPMVRWLAAAAILAAGIGIGRWGTMSRSEVRHELDEARMQWSLQARADQAAADREFAETVRALAVRQQEWMDDARREWASTRAVDHRAIQTALRGIEARSKTDAVALHAGLLRLAQETGNGFEQTEGHLQQLAGYRPDNSPANEPPLR